MSNRWVEHVRKFAKDNNMTYMCAITEASKTYKKSKDDELKSTPKNKYVVELGNKLNQKRTPQPKPQPKPPRYNLLPLISKREKELNEMKKEELKALLPAKFKNLKKEQLVNEVLKKDNIQVGVKGLEDWEYKTLQKAYYCLESMDRYKQKIPILKNELKKIQEEKEGSIRRQNFNRVRNSIEFLEDRIKECEESIRMSVKLNPQPQPQPKPQPKEQPKPQPQPKPKPEYRISVINKVNDTRNFDFNYTRDFEYKTIKTDLGYDFIFKNRTDYLTAVDMTMYNMDYKNERLYKWIYHN